MIYTIMRTENFSKHVKGEKNRLDHAVKLAHKLTYESRNPWVAVEVLKGTTADHTLLLVLVNVFNTVQVKKLFGTEKERTIIVNTLDKLED